MLFPVPLRALILNIIQLSALKFWAGFSIIFELVCKNPLNPKNLLGRSYESRNFGQINLLTLHQFPSFKIIFAIKTGRIGAMKRLFYFLSGLVGFSDQNGGGWILGFLVRPARKR